MEPSTPAAVLHRKSLPCAPFPAQLDEAPLLVPRFRITFHVAGKVGWKRGLVAPRLSALVSPAGSLKRPGRALPPVIGLGQTRDADICVEKTRFGTVV